MHFSWSELSIHIALLFASMAVILPIFTFIERYIGVAGTLPSPLGFKLLTENKANRKNLNKKFVQIICVCIYTSCMFCLLYLVPAVPAVFFASTVNNAEILYVIAFLSIPILAIMLLGTTSNSGLTLFDTILLSLSELAFTVVFIVNLCGIAFIFNTLDLNEIILAQASNFYRLPSWGIFISPFAFIATIICLGIVSQNSFYNRLSTRSSIIKPFEAELTGIILLGYTIAAGLRKVVVSALVANIFLGGYLLPGVNIDWFAQNYFSGSIAFLVFALKTVIIYILVQFASRFLPQFSNEKRFGIFIGRLLPLSILFLLMAKILLKTERANIVFNFDFFN